MSLKEAGGPVEYTREQQPTQRLPGARLVRRARSVHGAESRRARRAPRGRRWPAEHPYATTHSGRAHGRWPGGRGDRHGRGRLRSLGRLSRELGPPGQTTRRPVRHCRAGRPRLPEHEPRLPRESRAARPHTLTGDVPAVRQPSARGPRADGRGVRGRRRLRRGGAGHPGLRAGLRGGPDGGRCGHLGLRLHASGVRPGQRAAGRPGRGAGRARHRHRHRGRQQRSGRALAVLHPAAAAPRGRRRRVGDVHRVGHLAAAAGRGRGPARPGDEPLADRLPARGHRRPGDRRAPHRHLAAGAVLRLRRHPRRGGHDRHGLPDPHVAARAGDRRPSRGPHQPASRAARLGLPGRADRQPRQRLGAVRHQVVPDPALRHRGHRRLRHLDRHRSATSPTGSEGDRG